METAIAAAKLDYKKNYSVFKKANPFIEYYLSDTYDISEETAMKVAEQYKMLNPSK